MQPPFLAICAAMNGLVVRLLVVVCTRIWCHLTANTDIMDKGEAPGSIFIKQIAINELDVPLLVVV